MPSIPLNAAQRVFRGVYGRLGDPEYLPSQPIPCGRLPAVSNRKKRGNRADLAKTQILVEFSRRPLLSVPNFLEP